MMFLCIRPTTSYPPPYNFLSSTFHWCLPLVPEDNSFPFNMKTKQFWWRQPLQWLLIRARVIPSPSWASSYHPILSTTAKCMSHSHVLETKTRWKFGSQREDDWNEQMLCTKCYVLRNSVWLNLWNYMWEVINKSINQFETSYITYSLYILNLYKKCPSSRQSCDYSSPEAATAG